MITFHSCFWYATTPNTFEEVFRYRNEFQHVRRPHLVEVSPCGVWLKGGCEGVETEMKLTLVLTVICHCCVFSTADDGIIELGVIERCFKAVSEVDNKFIINFVFILIDFQSITGFLKKVVLNLIDRFVNSSRTAE